MQCSNHMRYVMEAPLLHLIYKPLIQNELGDFTSGVKLRNLSFFRRFTLLVSFHQESHLFAQGVL